MIWRPATTAWRVFFGQTAADYQDKIDEAKADGFAPIHVESYRSNAGVRYALICARVSGAWRARHGLTLDEHRAVLDQAKQDDLSPVCVSVVSIDGGLRYTVLYRSEDIGKSEVHSRLSADEYQQAVDDNRAAGRKPVYVNAYIHQDQHHFTAIFAEKPTGDWRARHALTGDAYQHEFELAHGDGLLTRVVTAFDGATQHHRYTAVWRA